MTISYNQGNFLEDCLKSTEASDEKQIQHIVIDAGSTDNSRNLLLQHARRRTNLRLVFEEDNGPADGLNKGLSLAEADWVSFLNSDDFFLEMGLVRLLNILKESNEYDFIYGNGLKFIGKKIQTKVVSKFSEKQFLTNQLKMFQQSTSFKRNFLCENGIIFNLNNKSCWDLEFCLDTVRAGSRNRKVDCFIGGFRIHDNSISGSLKLKQIYDYEVLRLKEECHKQYGLIEKVWQSFVSNSTALLFRLVFSRMIWRVKNENSHFSR